MIGRCVCITLAIALGFGVGTVLVDHSWSGFVSGTLMFPATAAVSMFMSYGILVFLVIFAYAICSIVLEMSEWTLLIPFFLCIWLGYDITDYQLNRSPMARILKQVNASLEKSAKEDKKQPPVTPTKKPAP
jgi:hypothetical protein